MPENRKLKVFLCHSKDDKPKVRELYRRLVADGFDAWLDEEKLMPGQDWDLEIRKAVRATDVVVVCLSNGSVTKTGYVQKEIRFALDVADEQPEGAIFIIPARIEECEAPLRLSKWQWVNLFEETGYERLKASLILRANKVGIILADIRPTTKNRSADITEPQLVKIPTGKFLMGSTKEQVVQAIMLGAENYLLEREQPQHIVELSDYFIGKYPITNREYQIFVFNAKHNPPLGWDGDQYPAEKSGHPVVNISWDDANTYCKWLAEKTKKNYRLPTEAEWEKASRGENGLIYPWGVEFDPRKANTSESNVGDSSEVGQFSPNGDSVYGCADMSGNVWEWCEDFFDENIYKTRINKISKDPLTPLKSYSHVVRGGSFKDVQYYARCAYRDKSNPLYSQNDYGFRVALSP